LLHAVAGGLNRAHLRPGEFNLIRALNFLEDHQLVVVDRTTGYIVAAPNAITEFNYRLQNNGEASRLFQPAVSAGITAAG